MIAGIRSFLFDLDGTLLDSIALILDAFRHTLRTHGIAVPADEVLLAGVGTPLVEQLRTLAGDSEPVETLLATYRPYAMKHHDAMVRAYPGVQEVVPELVARGSRLAIVSSKRREGVQRGLRRIGLLECFELIVGGDDVARGKPDPEPVQLALTRLGIPAAEALFVGDSPHDLIAGHAAGVRTAAAAWGPFPASLLEAQNPELWLRHPKDLFFFNPLHNR